MVTHTKPLFIPLKREFYLAFQSGTKNEELRPEGPRWNAGTCVVGRPVVLSLGYGKAHRLHGVITGYRSCTEPLSTDAWKACYGERGGRVARIEIRVNLDS